ncbi:hypothetical protein BJ508DRAFT_194249, partial [Ascobolus immersus RN42]
CGHNPEKERESFLATTSLSLQKISKDDLRHAKVIQQVDRKFILASLPSSSSSSSGDRLLVLIDQHAASERIRVEKFFEEICAEPTPSVAPGRPLLFQLGAHEVGLLERYRAHFESWGFRWQKVVVKGVPDGQSTISISTLPSLVVGRCVKEPTLAIDLLRTFAHALADSSAPSTPPSRKGKSWVEAVGSMPEKLVDMVNSKACRGAVMFNDELSLEECREIVEGLTGTRMPFICAHGRPSVVPLVELG